MLKRVADLPEMGRKSRKTFVDSELREFARNTTYDVAEVVIPGHTAHSICISLRKCIRKRPNTYKGIRACVRSGKCYLVREVSR